MPRIRSAADENISIKKFEFDSSMEFEDEEDALPSDHVKGIKENISEGWPELEEDPTPISVEEEKHLEGESEQTSKSEKIDTRNAILESAKLEAETIIAGANSMVDEIRAGAEKEKQQAIEDGKKQGYEIGYKEGQIEGEAKAKEAYAEMMQDEAKRFLKELKETVNEVADLKDQFVIKYFHEFCDLALTVAEKIVQVSLKSSGQVIQRMVVTATEKSLEKQWATVHISGFDEKILIGGGIDLLEAIGRISPNLKLEISPDGKPGTCIVELPDQIIDASVDTQLENIRDLIEEHEWNEDV